MSSPSPSSSPTPRSDFRTRLDGWERAAQLPLTLASLLFIAAYAWPVLDPDLPRQAARACALVVWGTWVLLVVDVVVRLAAAEDRWAFVRQHPIDIAAVVLPVLRPLQLLRLITLLKALNRYAGSSLRGRVGLYLGGSVVILVFIGALAVLDAERGHGGPITEFGDALWWALATITTVGYGDVYPVTTEGRFVAVGLMFCGIGVLGAVTASFASWLVERVEDLEEMEHGVDATAADVQELRDEVRALRELLQSRE